MIPFTRIDDEGKAFGDALPILGQEGGIAGQAPGLVELYEAVEPGFEQGVIGGKAAFPRAIALSRAQRDERPHAEPSGPACVIVSRPSSPAKDTRISAKSMPRTRVSCTLSQGSDRSPRSSGRGRCEQARA